MNIYPSWKTIALKGFVLEEISDMTMGGFGSQLINKL